MIEEHEARLLATFEDLELTATASIGSHLVFFSKTESANGSSSRSYPLSSFSSSIVEIEDSLMENETLPRLMLRMLRSNRHDSSGWFCLLLCSKLIRFAVQRAIPLWALKIGYLAALDAATEALQLQQQDHTTTTQARHPSAGSLALPLSWANLENIITVVETSMCQFKVLSLRKADLRSLAIALVSAFTTSLNGSGNGSNIFFKQIAGLPYQKTSNIKNALVMDIPLPPELTRGSTRSSSRSIPRSPSPPLLRVYEHLVVALFESSIELPEFAAGIDFEVTTATAGASDTSSTDSKERINSADTAGGHSILSVASAADGAADDGTGGGGSSSASGIKQVEFEYLEAVAQYLKRSGVTMVACQKRVHPYLRRLLSKMNILCIQRLSIRFIGALQRLSAARQLGCVPSSVCTSLRRNSRRPPEAAAVAAGALDRLDVSLLGYLARVSVETIFGKKLLVAWSSSASDSLGDDDKIHDKKEDDEEEEEEEEDDDEIDRKNMTVLLGEQFAECVLARRMRTSSIIVTAPSEALCGELQKALEEGARTLSACLECPYVLPGAGLWQAAVARHVSQQFLVSSPLLQQQQTSTSPPIIHKDTTKEVVEEEVVEEEEKKLLMQQQQPLSQHVTPGNGAGVDSSSEKSSAVHRMKPTATTAPVTTATTATTAATATAAPVTVVVGGDVKRAVAAFVDALNNCAEVIGGMPRHPEESCCILPPPPSLQVLLPRERDKDKRPAAAAATHTGTTPISVSSGRWGRSSGAALADDYTEDGTNDHEISMISYQNPWSNCSVITTVEYPPATTSSSSDSDSHSDYNHINNDGNNEDKFLDPQQRKAAAAASAPPVPTLRLLHADALEPLLIARKAVELAVEVALCVLDIDGEVISYPIEIDKSRS